MTKTLDTAQPTPSGSQHHPEAGFGLLCGIAAHVWWGLIPIYFKLVSNVPPIIVLAHRVMWSVLFVLILIALQRRWKDLFACVRSRNTMLMLIGSTLAIATNWYIFIWAVGHNQVIASSLGYFINPLVVVMLGMIFLGERMRRGQTIALLLAIGAVTALVVAEGRVPFVALGLAFSFAAYGLLRKIASVGPLVGLTVETLLLVPFALPLVAWQINSLNTKPATYGLLMLAGIITALPLLWFAAGARRLRLSTMGFLQYVTPTGQFLLGRFVYNEPFSRMRLGCFVVIWIALIVFTIDSVRAYRQHRAAAG